METYEKLGAFYLGQERLPDGAAENAAPVLYEAKDLTTHALIVGMTGSGKTGLATALIEEAAIDGIPALVIDPKGDLGNLLLQFPELRAEDFRPWVDEAEAARKGLTPDALAAKTADAWRRGLAESGQSGERIRRLQAAAELAVYTPGCASVRPLQVLRSFDAPPDAVRQDATALRDRILSAVSGLLALLGLDTDPVQSRDHILLSNILDRAWREGRSLDIARLIHEVQAPAFDKVGVFDLETFYPSRERLALAMRLNNVIAAPGFGAWMEGEPLDIQRLLYTPAGRPRVCVLSLAHLQDAERMFFVTLLLNEVLAWMRTQPGTGSLRALLYMDEIFGYFPPTANPPSKPPMLTLLKQARAFGLGVVLSTQNPVDLDYKGLSNCGTWFIGRLQTERDKMRVLEGLEGAAASSGAAFDRGQTEQILAGLGNRVFLMRNVHEEAPLLFQTRWSLSFLRGPLTVPQLAALARTAPPADTRPAAPAPGPDAASPMRPATPPDMPVFYRRPRTPGEAAVYRPSAIGFSKLHFVDAAAGLDVWTGHVHLAPLSEDGCTALWEESEQPAGLAASVDREPPQAAAFAPLPAGAGRPKAAAAWAKGLESFLYQTCTLELFSFPELKLSSRPEEQELDFRVRVAQLLRERRDEEVAKLKAKYAPKLQVLSDQLRRANERVEKEKAQSSQQKLNTALSLGATLLGAFLGRGRARVGTVGRATTAMRSASRIGKESADVDRAAESADLIGTRLQALQELFDQEAAALREPVSPEALELQKRPIRPRKSDIMTGTVGLCWSPWRRLADGTLEPAS